MQLIRRSVAATAIVLSAAACGGSTTAPSATEAPAVVEPSAAGISLVSVDQAATAIAAPLDDLVILDVRTPEEFADGHIDGAVMIDFYRPDFADELAKLDPDVPYVLYCRSGNRSGQTAALMEQLGFGSVLDVDGGVIAWHEAGLPLVTD